MRLLVVGKWNGQLSTAVKMAMSAGAKVSHVETIEAATHALRAGQGADLMMVDYELDIAQLIATNEAERIRVPGVAGGVGAGAAGAAAAIRAGAKEYIPLPPDAELIAAVLAAVAEENSAFIFSDPKFKSVLQLVGHARGASTGALARRIGKFEEAHGGPLLLDEISEMHPRLQAKLLRAVQEREIDRVGGAQPVKVDIRLVATSNRDMQDEVRKGNFREDLFFRLNVMALELPPLRDRPGDIPVLAAHFVKKYGEANGIRIDGIA